MATSPVTLDFSKAQPLPSSSQSDPGSGVTLDFSQAQPIQTPIPDALHIDPNDNVVMKGLKGLNSIGAGIGQGVLSTLNGGADLLHLPHATLQQRQQELEQQNSENPTLNKIGYGSENVAELMMGDEALKALPYSERLLHAARTMKLLEKSPVLMRAVEIGTNALRAGTAQGVQTYVHTGGDAGQAVHDAVTMAGTAGVIGAATGAAGGVISNLGKRAAQAKALASIADTAASKPEVADALAQRIEAAKTELHNGYENGINDLHDRLAGSEVSAQDNPLADRAKELLANPDPAEHPLVSQTKQVAGDRLDKPVRALLDSYATGELAGKGETKAAPPYTINDLVDLRQTIRKIADGYEYGDINARALRQLLPSVDDTIGKLAEQSGDDTALSDYQELRDNYRHKINLFDDPVIQKIRAGKVDDAARDFVGTIKQGSALPSTGKVGYNLDVLQGIIGDDGVKAFGKDVVGTILKDSTQAGRFNPEQFVKTWKRITPETKAQLFDANNAASGIQQLLKNAQSAATLQKISKGLLGAGMAKAATAGVLSHTGYGLLAAVGLLSAEGGSIMAGRELLNHLATHPQAWNLYEGAAKTANSPIAKGAAQLGGIVAGHAASSQGTAGLTSSGLSDSGTETPIQ